MGDEFVALQQELNAALKKAGMPRRTVWQVIRGDRSEFRIVGPMNNFAELDQPGWGAKAFSEADFRRFVARIVKCCSGRRILISRTYPDRSIPLKEGRQRRYMLLTVRENLPGKGPAYGAYLRDEVIPAYKKAGVDGVMVSRRWAGGNPRVWVMAQFFDKWEELDGPSPLVTALGQEKAAKLGLKGGGLIAHAERLILTFREDLSFTNE